VQAARGRGGVAGPDDAQDADGQLGAFAREADGRRDAALPLRDGRDPDAPVIADVGVRGVEVGERGGERRVVPAQAVERGLHGAGGGRRPQVERGAVEVVPEPPADEVRPAHDPLPREERLDRLAEPVTAPAPVAPEATAPQTGSRMPTSQRGGDLRLATRLRIGAAIGLAALPVFLPLHLRYGPSDHAPLAVSYGCYAALALAALAASWLVRSPRRLLDMTFLLVVGTALDANLYFHRSEVDLAVAANLLTVLLMGSALLFPWTPRRTAAACAITALPFLVIVAARPPGAANPAHAAYGTAALVVGAMVALAGSVVLRGAREGLARAQQELAGLSARLMTSQEEERRRLSRELHDGVGQSISAVAAYLQSLERQIPAERPDLRLRAADARRLAVRTLAEIRELSQLLRPSTLDDFGLVPSLTTYLREFQERHGIAAHLSADGLPERLPPDMETAVYRVVQEALTNVARHAHATRVRVTCRADESELTVEVHDDGIGLSGRNGGGVGLIGIRERILGLGGRVHLASRGGVQLVVHLPLAR